jgi:hypothetical protein
MKKQLIILGIALSLITSACHFMSNFTGDKNIIRKGKNVETFQAIEIGSSIDNMKVYFTQDSDTPLIRIEVDSNILDKLSILVKNNTLIIKQKEEDRWLRLSPSVCNIYCNAAALNRVAISGSSEVICQTPLTGEALKIQISGLGKFIAEHPSSITHFNTFISGSGDVTFFGNGQVIECNLTGSGNIKLNGNYSNMEGVCTGSSDLHLTGHINKANLRITGSGSVDAQKCAINQLEAQISGSGNISAEVTEMLSVKISGSGSVRYKGNPTVNISVSGSGEVKRIE